ncbi:ZIP family metal transporter [Candidatus Woesearchaeota archaeon]|nr:ZIP family metal transporter [Candidatus Woesearchaeota archaeon]
MLLAILASTVIISLVSLVGLFLMGEHVKRWLHYLIAFAAGTLLAVSFFDLIPEALHELEESLGFHAADGLLFVLIGIVLFFLIERFIHWHHCGKEDCEGKPAGLLILTGDFVHNFLDGLLIAGAYLLDFRTGVLATISIIAHEIPQEIGDYSVLLHAGYPRRRALLLNFYSALSAIAGGAIGYFLLHSLGSIIPFVVAVTAGGFIYIALADIVPALHRHDKEERVLVTETLIFLATMAAFYFLLGMASHAH